jgi:AraC-like DNA-binding protein
MGSPFFAGRESELRALIYKSDRVPLDRQLRWAACRGIDPDAFHPDEGRPDDAVSRAASTAKLALPASRSRCEPKSLTRVMAGTAVLARTTALLSPRPLADGWTVEAIANELGCSRRTVQRYLRIAA